MLDELEQVIQDLREALHEHAKRLREADVLFTRNGPPLPTSIRDSLIRLVGEKFLYTHLSLGRGI